jgi:hypothetical protein
MTGTMSVLDKTGDSKIKWNPDNEGEVVAARAHFDALKAKGYVGYRTEHGGGRGSVIREFDPAASEIIMAPQSRGG